MRKHHTLLTRRLLTLAVACAPLVAFAQITPPVPAYPTPYDPHLDEHVGIPVWNGQCPAPAFDPEQVPQLRQTAFTPGVHSPQQDVYEYELTYGMVNPELCFSPPAPAGFYGKIDVGTFPEGHHKFVVKGATDDEAVYVQYDVDIYVGPTDGFRDDVSGAWYAPEQSGRGVSVIRAPGGLTTVYWAMHDAEGHPAWVLLTDNPEDNEQRNVIEGTAVYTHGDPLAPGATTLDTESWGEVRFTYERCGHTRLEWDALDPALGEGSLDMMQALLPSGVYACDIQNDPSTVVAERIEE